VTDLIYFEDVQVGDTHRFGQYAVTRGEIIEYAQQFDPQPFHLDEEAAKKSMFGGLIASGWHTGAMLIRMLCDHAIPGSATTGALGFDDLKWLKPVRPGDTLTGRTEVLETWPSRSKPIGFIRRRNELINQHDEVVVAVVGITMYRRRPAAAA